MDEKRPPRRAGPRPLLDELILCIALRGDKKDRIKAFAALPRREGQPDDSQARIVATLRKMAQRASRVGAFAPRVVILRPAEMKRVIDDAAKEATGSCAGACRFQTSELRIGSFTDSRASSPEKKLTGALDTGAQSAALLWTACSLAERALSASALVVPGQLTWRQLLDLDSLPPARSTRLGRLTADESNGFRELRSASWSSGAAVRRRTDGDVGVKRQHRSDADPRNDLVAFRACASVSLLRRAAQVDEGKSESPIFEFGDGVWPVAGGMGQRRAALIHRAGLSADADAGDFGLGPCPIHMIIPVRTPECAPAAARWVVDCLDSQISSFRIVAHPVLMTAGGDSGVNGKLSSARATFIDALQLARSKKAKSGHPRSPVLVRGFAVPDEDDAYGARALEANDTHGHFEPAHFAYARDCLRTAESVDYVVFAGTEFEVVHSDWIDSLWRRREPGCGAAWFGRSYKAVDKIGEPAHGPPPSRSAPIRAVADAIDASAHLLQIQGCIRRSLTAFHTGAFRSGSVVDARLFDPDSELWSVLDVLKDCVDRGTRAAKESSSGVASASGRNERLRRRKKVAPRPSQGEVVAEVRMVVADVALSYALRPPSSEFSPGPVQSRIPRVFAIPQTVSLGLRPKGSGGDYLRAESLHLTNAYRRRKSLAHKRPSTDVVWSSQDEALSVLQAIDGEWSSYVRSRVAERGEALSLNISNPLKDQKTPVPSTPVESRLLCPPSVERTLIVYYEDAAGCSPSVVRFGLKNDDDDYFVDMASAAAFGAANQTCVVQNFIDRCMGGVEVRVLASGRRAALSAMESLKRRNASADEKRCSFSCEEVKCLSEASYFGAWLAAARSSLAHVTTQTAQRAFTRVLMLRSVPLWGARTAEVYAREHVLSFDDVGLSDAGIMPFSGGIDLSVMCCRPWFLRAALGWIEQRPCVLERAHRSAVDARVVWKRIAYSLHASVALWCLPYTYACWRARLVADEDAETRGSASRTLVAMPAVKRRGTNIISPAFPSIRYRWRAMYTSDRIR